MRPVSGIKIIVGVGVSPTADLPPDLGAAVGGCAGVPSASGDALVTVEHGKPGGSGRGSGVGLCGEDLGVGGGEICVGVEGGDWARNIESRQSDGPATSTRQTAMDAIKNGNSGALDMTFLTDSPPAASQYRPNRRGSQNL